jgi:isocitrate dehydrogenase
MNPSSVILSGCMLLEYIGWKEAADLITSALQATIMRKNVTIDFYNLMTGATLLKTTEFGDAIIENMGVVTGDAQLKKSSSL